MSNFANVKVYSSFFKHLENIFKSLGTINKPSIIFLVQCEVLCCYYLCWINCCTGNKEVNSYFNWKTLTRKHFIRRSNWNVINNCHLYSFVQSSTENKINAKNKQDPLLILVKVHLYIILSFIKTKCVLIHCTDSF